MEVYVVSKSNPLVLVNPISRPEILLSHQRRSKDSQTLLEQVKTAGAELRCCCLPVPARMFVRFSHDYFTLVNHPSEGEHHKECPLYTPVNGYGHDRKDEPVEAPQDDSSLNFRLHRFEQAHARKRSIDKAPSPTRTLIEKSFHNYHFKSKRHSIMRALHTLLLPAKNITFGETSLESYCFYGERGFEFATSKLKREVRYNCYTGAGRPHALVFFSTNNYERLAATEVQINGRVYSVKNIHCQPLFGDSALVVLSVALNTTTNNIECYNAYIYPIVSTTLFMPVESESELQIAHGLMAAIDDSTSNFSWSFAKPLFSNMDKAKSSTELPSFILKSKNESKRVNYVEVIRVIDSDINRTKPRQRPMMSLDVWQANCICTVDPSNEESLASFWKEHQL
jgi:hypothetical protein